MALFKISKGSKNNLPTTLTEGYCWYTYDDSKFYIDFKDANGVLQRKALNAKEAEQLVGYTIATILSSSEVEIPTSKAVFDALANKADKKHSHTAEDLQIDISDDLEATLKVANDYTDEQVADLTSTVETNYDETIIALSVDGTTVTYIKGDGSVHTFETQDTNTTYSLGTDSVTGLTKLYATTGNAEDGTMTQKAIKTELDKKVGVTMDDANHTLIFTK
jgi:hypothetical protein